MDVTAEGDLDLRPFHQLEGAKTVIAIDPDVPGCVLLRIGDIEVGLLNIFDEQRVVRYEHVAAGARQGGQCFDSLPELFLFGQGRAGGGRVAPAEAHVLVHKGPVDRPGGAGEPL